PAQIPVVFLSFTNHARAMATANGGLLVLGLGLGVPLTWKYGAAGMAASLLLVEATIFLGFLSLFMCKIISASYFRFLGVFVAGSLVTGVPSFGLSVYLIHTLHPATFKELVVYGLIWAAVSLLVA